MTPSTALQDSPEFRWDVVSMLENSSPPMFALSVLLILCSAVVWFTIVVKWRQLRRWRRAEEEFEAQLRTVHTLHEATAVIRAHADAIAGHMLARLGELVSRAELIETETEYVATLQEQRVLAGLTLLASIATAAPLAGLFGTVYGIMEAFARIGTLHSGSLQVVAPAIGDALVTTIVGLFAAIPAVVAVNLFTRQGELLLGQSRAFAKAWLQRITMLPR